MGTDVADVTEHKTDEHKEEADQREWCGRTDHLWKKTRKSQFDICCYRAALVFSIHPVLFSDCCIIFRDLLKMEVVFFPLE